ncbi:MAG: hypothetical protein JO057_24855 [Chloroflexi bacterium]|nr:hypothetical protein [Chloroflexota bacterium]
MVDSHRRVLLIGSLPYTSADEAFDAIGPPLASYAKSLPDGEAQGWINFPANALLKSPSFEQSDREYRLQAELPAFRFLRLKPGVQPAQAEIPPIGYDQIALHSYQVFKAARAAGKIAPGTRFQVSLPTPFGVLGVYLIAEDVPNVLPRFEEIYMRDVDNILQSIPAEDLSMQWDVAVEIVGALEGHTPGLLEHAPKEYIAEAIARISDRIPEPVELGLHYCYGNPGGHHIIQPKDTNVMVDFSNQILDRTRRQFGWVHMPVPQDRKDEAYFAPLGHLALDDQTTFCLGLVHLGDGLEGSRKRLEARRSTLLIQGLASPGSVACATSNRRTCLPCSSCTSRLGP